MDRSPIVRAHVRGLELAGGLIVLGMILSGCVAAFRHRGFDEIVTTSVLAGLLGPFIGFVFVQDLALAVATATLAGVVLVGGMGRGSPRVDRWILACYAIAGGAWMAFSLLLVLINPGR